MKNIEMRKKQPGTPGTETGTWNRIKRCAKKTLRGVGIAGAAVLIEGMLLLAPIKANATEAWITAYPGYSYSVPNDSYNPNIRVVGGGKLPAGIVGSAVLNAVGTERNSFDLQFGHTELRLQKVFLNWFGPLAHYEIEPGPANDAARFGLVVKPSIGEDTNLLVRILPFGITVGKGGPSNILDDPKIAAYFSQRITSSVVADLYLEWTRKNGSLFAEIAADYMITESFGAGAQIRHNFAPGKEDSTMFIPRLVLNF